jgi:hypothetical protein
VGCLKNIAISNSKKIRIRSRTVKCLFIKLNSGNIHLNTIIESKMLYSLKTCFYLNNYKKIIHLRLFQIIIINKKMIKLSVERIKRQK